MTYYVALSIYMLGTTLLTSQYCRIVAAKGRVTIEPNGVGRIYLPTVNMPGLAMSRSLGDRAVHQIGVTAEPQMLHKELKESLGESLEGLLLLGTDGVFDMNDNASLAAALREPGISSQQNSDGLIEKSVEELNSVALHIDTDSEDDKMTPTTPKETVTPAAAAAVRMAQSLDALLDNTFNRWMSTVGLSDDISLIAVRISQSYR